MRISRDRAHSGGSNNIDDYPKTTTVRGDSLSTLELGRLRVWCRALTAHGIVEVRQSVLASDMGDVVFASDMGDVDRPVFLVWPEMNS